MTDFNTRLNQVQISRIASEILDKRNFATACKLASIHPDTLKAALFDAGLIKSSQISILMDFCDKVEGLTIHNDAD